MAKWIVVSPREHLLRLYDGKKLVKIYSIAVGKALTPTPSGVYTIVNKQRNPGGPYGAFWMGLSRPHYGIHGTNDPASIGRDVSGGCIRMHNADVLELSTLPIGTWVFVQQY